MLKELKFPSGFYLDYFNILVHIFQPEARAYYNLEQLWSDAEIQQF